MNTVADNPFLMQFVPLEKFKNTNLLQSALQKKNILNCWKETFKQLEPPSSWRVTAPYSRLEKSNSILVGQNFDRCIGCTQKGSSKIDLTNSSFISRLTEHTLSIMKEM